MIDNALRVLVGGTLGCILMFGVTAFAPQPAVACGDVCWERSDGSSCCYDCGSDKTTCIKVGPAG
jgi:hypothetical protein